VQAPKSGRGLPALPRLRQAPGPRRAGSAGGAEWLRRARPITLGVMAALLLALLAWCAVPPLLSEDRDQELKTLIQTVGTQITSAEQSPNPVVQREAATAALAALAQARALNPEDARIAPLSGRLQALLDDLDAIEDVAGLRSILTFEGAVTAPFSPLALIAGGGDLWLLDGDRGRVLRVDPVGGVAPEEVYLPGGAYSASEEGTAAREGVTAGEAIFATWDETAGRLLVLDQDRQLFAVAPGASPTPLALRDAAAWRSVGGIAAYDGNLYVLDPAGGEVWRYLPAGEGFDSERDGLLGAIDLTGAAGLSVSGDVAVLTPDAVRRFRQGAEQGEQLLGIDRPLTEPAGVSGDATSGLIFVADRGGQRIVVADRNGLFVRQYRHAEFFDLRGVALAPDGATLYVLTGQGIHAFAADTTTLASAGAATPPAVAATATMTAEPTIGSSE